MKVPQHAHRQSRARGRRGRRSAGPPPRTATAPGRRRLREEGLIMPDTQTPAAITAQATKLAVAEVAARMQRESTPVEQLTGAINVFRMEQDTVAQRMLAAPDPTLFAIRSKLRPVLEPVMKLFDA